MEIVGSGRGAERTLQQIIQRRAAGMENDTCGRQVFHNYADVCRKLRQVDSGCRSDTAVFTGSVAMTRPFVSDVTLVLRSSSILPVHHFVDIGEHRNHGSICPVHRVAAVVEGLFLVHTLHTLYLEHPMVFFLACSSFLFGCSWMLGGRSFLYSCSYATILKYYRYCTAVYTAVGNGPMNALNGP